MHESSAEDDLAGRAYKGGGELGHQGSEDPAGKKAGETRPLCSHRVFLHL